MGTVLSFEKWGRKILIERVRTLNRKKDIFKADKDLVEAIQKKKKKVLSQLDHLR